MHSTVLSIVNGLGGSLFKDELVYVQVIRMKPEEAAEAVTREMGTEALLEAEPPDPPLPLRERCSPWRRGVS